jgi:hypothetical protein
VTTRQAVYFQQRMPLQKHRLFGFRRSHSLFNPAQPEAELSAVEKKLEAILKHKRIPATDCEAYLRRIDRNHAAACESEGWRKEDGQFVKSLRNYLAPTEERYDVEPARAARKEPARLMA